jgi:hypothetical protein
MSRLWLAVLTVFIGASLSLGSVAQDEKKGDKQDGEKKEGDGKKKPDGRKDGEGEKKGGEKK